jgi:hypothetical protein
MLRLEGRPRRRSRERRRGAAEVYAKRSRPKESEATHSFPLATFRVAMEVRPVFVLLGVATLFLGGLAGGMLGTTFLARTPSEQTPQTASPNAAPGESSRELARAIESLAARIQALGERPAETARNDRQPIADPASPALQEDRVVAALDRLSSALELSQGRAAPGGIGITPLVLPPPGSKRVALEALVGRGWEDLSREFRFLTFQQVLDQFGRPDLVENESWVYLLDGGDAEKSFRFQFAQGYVMNVFD